MDCPILCDSRTIHRDPLLHPDCFKNPLTITPSYEQHLSKKTVLGKIITYSSIGIQIGFTIGIGIIGGVYLDRWLNTGPWLTLLGLLIGVVSGFTRLYQIGKEFNQR